VTGTLTATGKAGRRLKGGRQAFIEQLMGVGFAFPAFLLLAVITIAPLIALVVLSFTDYELRRDRNGRRRSRELYQGARGPGLPPRPEEHLSLRRARLPGAVLLGLFVAVLVQSRTRTRWIYQIIYFLPVTSTLIAMATVWQALLHPRLGPVGATLRLLGVGEVAFLSEPSLVLPTLAVIGIWQLLGFNMVLFMAGLSAIPRDLYEAAEIDGCTGALDRFVTITLPLLGPTTIFVIVTTSITAFKVFDTVAVMTRGGPAGSSEVLLYTIYLEAFQYFHTAYGAALTRHLPAFCPRFLGRAGLRARAAGALRMSAHTSRPIIGARVREVRLPRRSRFGVASPSWRRGHECADHCAGHDRRRTPPPVLDPGQLQERALLARYPETSR
jgi:multiple sugar transport system permease protein